MRFSTYSALNGTCSALIGVLFVISGFPGLFGDDGGSWWLAVPAVLIVPVIVGATAARRGTPLTDPGRWLTDRPIEAATAGDRAMPAGPLRKRLLIETAVWAVVALIVIVGFTTSRPFAYATGWASLAYGLLELFASAPRVRRVEADRGTVFFVRRRPGFGTPELTT